MICEHCGHSVPDGSLTCDRCGCFLGTYGGRTLGTTGVRGIRQGRVSAQPATLPSEDASENVREYGDYDLSSVPLHMDELPPRARYAAGQGESSSRPNTKRGVPVNAYGRAPNLKRHGGRHGSPRGVGKRGVNWMLIAVILACIALVGAVGYFVYMSRSDNGQRITARRNVLAATEGMFALARSDDPLALTERDALLKGWNDAPAQAYWLVGQEYMDVGDIAAAITAFRLADIIDPENYDGLLLLANAYELDSQDEAAEKIYLNLETTVSPFRSEAYTALIRMYQAQERRPEAADMMLLAYQQTDKENFRLLRKDYIPQMPQVPDDMPAGRYKMDQTLLLTSPQGYDIYYTVDDEAVLPDEGTLLEGDSLHLGEGTVTLRAVCVSGDLCSDILSVGYTIYYPTPPAPKCNLAPNTYKSLRDVTLRPGVYTDKDDEKADKDKLKFYYTIDGSTPTVDSPEFDGTPIKLPTGKVTLRAICVNQYGKVSSALEVGYRFSVKPDPLKIYSEEDVFSGFVLNSTSVTEFTNQIGQPKEQIDTTYLNMDGQAVHLNYGWGYAVFYLNGNKWQMVRMEMTSGFTQEPRGVGLGSTENEICAVYKDFGQLEAANGTRGLYYDYPNVGQVLVNDDGTRTVSYSCSTKESNVWKLEYHLGKNGRCDKITHYYQP